MMMSVRPLEVLRCIVLPAALALAAGCASSPPQAQPPAQPAATATAPATGRTSAASTRIATATPAVHGEGQTPMSDVRLVESAEFASNALQHGFTPEVREGVVVYCWVNEDIGSRIATKKCMDKAQLQITLRQRQAQRDAIEHDHTFGCQPGINCANDTGHGLGRQQQTRRRYRLHLRSRLAITYSSCMRLRHSIFSPSRARTSLRV